MSESDQTWNAAGDEPAPASEASQTAETPPAPASPSGSAADHAWPQYSWPEADATPTTPSTPSTPATENPSPSVSWPVTQEQPATTRPQPTIEFTPLGAPGPYATGPSPASDAPGSPTASGAGGWGPPPGWAAATPTWPPTAPASAATWPPTAPAPAPAPTSSMSTIQKRVLAIVAAVALVLASAGIGAGIAVAVHDGSKATPFSAGLVQPNTNNGSGNNGSTTPGSIDVNAIAAKVDPAIVNINTTLANGRAAGTGMLISSDGEILTNNHVIADATSIKVVIGGKGDSHNAKVVGYDVSHDVALLKITDDVKDLPTIVFGDPSKVKVGDPVVAIGNAGGVGGTPSATSGQVTLLDQQVTASDGQGNQETLEGMIQIDAPIQPGDSGGALINSDGQIIGMNTAAAGSGRFNFNTPTTSNVGFAIPIDAAVHIISQIRSGKETDTVFIGERGLLGVQIEDLNGQSAPVSSGAFVEQVQSDSGADHAGIEAGAVVTEVDGKPVTDSTSLRAALSHFHSGESVKVVWVDSSGGQHEANVTLVPGPPL
jgi:S1-C subfamily serine protease